MVDHKVIDFPLPLVGDELSVCVLSNELRSPSRQRFCVLLDDPVGTGQDFALPSRGEDKQYENNSTHESKRNHDPRQADEKP